MIKFISSSCSCIIITIIIFIVSIIFILSPDKISNLNLWLDVNKYDISSNYWCDYKDNNIKFFIGNNALTTIDNIKCMNFINYGAIYNNFDSVFSVFPLNN